MYGLVNQAVQNLILDRFGEETWRQIREKANVDVVCFANMESYDDDITYQLVNAASDILKRPAPELLEAFGEYWTIYTAQEGYGDFLKLGGETFKTFILNLNNLHTRVAMIFPNLQPPIFTFSEITDHSLCLRYYSKRIGLAPMVIGLIKGLGKRFSTDVKITLTAPKKDGQNYDEFQILFDT